MTICKWCAESIHKRNGGWVHDDQVNSGSACTGTGVAWNINYGVGQVAIHGPSTATPKEPDVTDEEVAATAKELRNLLKQL